jgi:hypothetical protein
LALRRICRGECTRTSTILQGDYQAATVAKVFSIVIKRSDVSDPIQPMQLHREVKTMEQVVPNKANGENVLASATMFSSEL